MALTLTKNVRTLLASTSNAANATTAGTATWSQLSTALEGTALITVINGSTGPTTGCGYSLQVSPDGGATWREVAAQTAGLVALQAYTFTPPIPRGTQLARVVFAGNTGQACQVEAFGLEDTSIG